MEVEVAAALEACLCLYRQICGYQVGCQVGFHAHERHGNQNHRHPLDFASSAFETCCVAFSRAHVDPDGSYSCAARLDGFCSASFDPFDRDRDRCDLGARGRDHDLADVHARVLLTDARGCEASCSCYVFANVIFYDLCLYPFLYLLHGRGFRFSCGLSPVRLLHLPALYPAKTLHASSPTHLQSDSCFFSLQATGLLSLKAKATSAKATLAQGLLEAEDLGYDCDGLVLHVQD
mmetsp:Transcript_96937/g.152796  ORF Transcript_96937/g.152796 Transcript_96937/m.152796 type:complete len:234 (-) Transcript_96937:806-1507(-)